MYWIIKMINIFKYENHKIRFINDNPIAIDIIRALNYENTIKTLDDIVSDNNWFINKINNDDYTILLRDDGIKELIYYSGYEYPNKFYHWIFNEILPKLKKN